MVIIVRLKFLHILLDTIRKVCGQHFLLQVSFIVRVPCDIGQAVRVLTWNVAGVCSKIQVPALSAVMFLTVVSLCLARKAISSPCEWSAPSISSGAWVVFPQIASPPFPRLLSSHHKMMGISKGPTLTHMLALPTQLRNSLARSFLEKNRSSTRRRKVSSFPGTEQWGWGCRTIGTCRVHLDCVFHLP